MNSKATRRLLNATEFQSLGRRREMQKASKNVVLFEAFRICQQSELNGQPPVYKTGALPIELCWRWSQGDQAGGMIWTSAFAARPLASFCAWKASWQQGNDWIHVR